MRKRLDALVVELGLFPSRQLAQSAIMNGGILVNGKVCTKPGTILKAADSIVLSPRWSTSRYVSRGGLKLEKALEQFRVDAEGRVCLDVGASSGGFTDCLLKHGAAKVYAIDVGYGQLDWSLRNDPRVVVKERLNARLLSPQTLYLPEDTKANLLTVDVSFISIVKILLPCLSCMHDGEIDVICLIKPQFEAGKDRVEKGGVVRSAETHVEVLRSVDAQVEGLGLSMAALTYSPLKGPAGNIEFPALFKHQAAVRRHIDFATVVHQAHEALNAHRKAQHNKGGVNRH